MCLLDGGGRVGGFFASGFKRALGVKDFGDSIPGHGGVTDRFDCQMPMAVFSYLYYHMYIARDQEQEEVLDGLLDMSAVNKLKVFAKLGGMLVVEGLLDGGALQGLLGSRDECRRILTRAGMSGMGDAVEGEGPGG